MEAFSKIFVEQYGAFAVYSGFFITAVCPIPLPDHALSVFAMIGGLNFWVNVGVSTLGSIMGGVVAYFLGKLLKHTAIYAKLMKRYKTQSEHLINKYGAWGLAIATLTNSGYCCTTS
jgi:membrane protein YqaA with SNARE-associated domain